MGTPLDIALDRDAEVPLGVQLAWALRTRIEGGTLAAGERLPGLQRLAGAVGVNANTVRAVYRRLEQDGLVTTRHGSGTFVTGGGEQRRALAQLAADAARAARVAGVDPRDVATALYVEGGAAAGSATAAAAPTAGATAATAGGPAAGDAAARRRLRTQIAALERALSELTARQAAPGEAARTRRAPARGAATAGPRLPSAAELERERDELLERLAAAQATRGEHEDRRTGEEPPASRRARATAPRLRTAPRPT